MYGEHLKKTDPAVYELIREEWDRQNHGIELIASENYPSLSTMEAAGSMLCCKYAEGYPDARYYGGCEVVDKVEALAIERAKELFHCDHVNVQPHSGTSANLAVYAGLLKPGGRIMAMDLKAGGHLSFATGLSQSGDIYEHCHYGVDEETGLLDYDAIEEMAMEFKPNILLCGASAYPRIIDFERFRSIADKCGSLLMADISHIAGLVAAGLHPSPVFYADVITTTTHKTARGNRGAIIMCRKEFAKFIDKAVFPKLQGGPLMNMIAAKAVGFGEALTPAFTAYQKQTLKNLKAMEDVFREEGIHMVTDGSDNHLLLLDLRGLDISGADAEKLLNEYQITVNKNMIPGDPLPAKQTSGIRIGTAAVTTRGFKESDCAQVARVIASILKGKEADITCVRETTQKYPLYLKLFESR